MYTLKGIKVCENKKCSTLKATLYRDGKKAATIVDHANGDPLEIVFVNDFERDELEAHVLATPGKVFEDEGETLPLPLSGRIEVFIDNLVTRTTEINNLFRKSRRAIYFIHEGKILSKKGTPPTEENIALFRKKNRVAPILSEAKTVAELEEMLDYYYLRGYLSSITKF